MMIGIDKDRNLVYEGSSNWGHALWPSPPFTPAKISCSTEGHFSAANRPDPIDGGCIFREDAFDPSSRIRRGRFYEARGAQPAEWHVQVHPALPTEKMDVELPGTIRKRLDTYYACPLQNLIPSDCKSQPLVLLGFRDRFSIWSIVNVEAISTGEDLVTLKARSGLGVLPEIIESKILKRYRARVQESLANFADEVHRSAPISVIDRARDAVSEILLAKYKATSSDAKDLGAMANRLEQDEFTVAACSARIIARLHARAKPVEKAKRKLRPIREQDAELAVQCVGTVLCEIGWADWP